MHVMMYGVKCYGLNDTGTSDYTYLHYIISIKFKYFKML